MTSIALPLTCTAAVPEALGPLHEPSSPAAAWMKVQIGADWSELRAPRISPEKAQVPTKVFTGAATAAAGGAAAGVVAGAAAGAVAGATAAWLVAALLGLEQPARTPANRTSE